MPELARLPSGTVTFLFTDIEGSTRLWQTDAGTGAASLQRLADDPRRARLPANRVYQRIMRG